MREHVFRAHGGEKIQLGPVLRIRPHGVVQQVAVEPAGRAIQLHGFMDNAYEPVGLRFRNVFPLLALGVRPCDEIPG